MVLIEDNFNFLTKMCTTARRESALAMIALAAARGCRVAVNGPDAADNPAIYLVRRRRRGGAGRGRDGDARGRRSLGAGRRASWQTSPA